MRFQCGPPARPIPKCPRRVGGLVRRIDKRGSLGAGIARILLRHGLLEEMAPWTSGFGGMRSAKRRYTHGFRNHPPGAGSEGKFILDARGGRPIAPLRRFHGHPRRLVSVGRRGGPLRGEARRSSFRKVSRLGRWVCVGRGCVSEGCGSRLIVISSRARAPIFFSNRGLTTLGFVKSRL